MGVITPACDVSAIGRSSYYRWLKEDADFKAAVDEVAEVSLDFAESALFRQIADDVPSSTAFYLRSKGAGRGYGTKLEVEMSGAVKSEASKLSDEELADLIKKAGLIQKPTALSLLPLAEEKS